ncbi:cytochrome b/b6 domain-containing protein [Burkholderia sp. Ac-20365]|uniref:cytochrome b n=1 Tax=Burkholderia sp. Ac-20365 TaxID=2703897 RepID=UPI00197C2714|nr:cytochrome b/b6 domain-containing protein [Burkholderia sp. Ac-20365]MBN3762156.1 cytochrome B [Burkholderia sp. Ac-20365]
MSNLPVSSMHDPESHGKQARGRFQWRDNGLGFSPVTIVLHWIVALLVLSIIGIEIARFAEPDVALTRVLNLLGTILFPVSVYRFWARVTSWHPLPVGTPNPIEVIVSRSVATALALAMVLLPVAAWLAKSAAGQLVELPGGWIIPSPMQPNAQAAQVFDALFKIGATPFLLGLALHIFGACKNHFVLKNDALKRMLGKRVEL